MGVFVSVGVHEPVLLIRVTSGVLGVFNDLVGSNYTSLGKFAENAFQVKLIL